MSGWGKPQLLTFNDVGWAWPGLGGWEGGKVSRSQNLKNLFCVPFNLRNLVLFPEKGRARISGARVCLAWSGRAGERREGHPNNPIPHYPALPLSQWQKQPLPPFLFYDHSMFELQGRREHFSEFFIKMDLCVKNALNLFMFSKNVPFQFCKRNVFFLTRLNFFTTLLAAICSR